jgi:hypothetical protein
MIDLFYKIETPCTIVDDVKKYIAENNITWTWVPYMTVSFDFQTNLGKLLTEKDSTLKMLSTNFVGSMLRLYKFPSMTCYDWHRDASIGCSLNMLLEDYHSLTLFIPSSQRKILNPVVSLKYEKNFWYLFNSQVLHSVVNVDEEDRILLTMTFPTNVKYKDVFDFLQQNNLN